MSNEIANSSDAEDEVIELAATSSSKTTGPTPRRVLSAVVIDKNKMAPDTAIVPFPEVKGSRSVSTNTSSTEDNMEYDTPNTSISVTPAEFGNGNKMLRTRSAAEETYTLGSKRKRGSYAIKDESDEELDTVKMDITGDAELARALQEQEYGEADFKCAKTEAGPSSRRKPAILDSDDEDDLSSIATVESDAMEEFKTPAKKATVAFKARPKKHAAKAASKGRISRQASSSAKKAISQPKTETDDEVDDSEDDDAFSLA
ncbi:hypothetical protein LTS18_011074, partial [Coniosporium uncinatum]